jgi:outer membrane protein TolC
MRLVQRFTVVLFAALGLSSVLQAQITPSHPEALLPELSRLLEKARENAPTLVAQSLAKEESAARLDVARAASYPRFDLYSTIGIRQTTYDVLGAEDETSAGANFNAIIRRPLYHWGAIEARIKQARLDQANEDLQRVLVLRQIKRGLRANYLNLLVNQASLAQLRLRRESASAQLARLGSDQQAGLVSTLDATQLNLNQEQTLIDIDAVEADQRRILAAYQREIGWDEPLALDQPVPAPDLAAIKAWIERTRSAGLGEWLHDHAEVQRRRNLLEREKAELVWIKSRQRPLFNAAASATRDQRSVAGDNNADALTLFAGVEVSWNVFDGFETSARTREASARLRRMERQLEAYRAELSAQAYAVLDQIGFQVRQLQLNEKRAQATTEGLRSAERDADEGRLSAQALRERQLSAQETSLNVLRTRVTLLLALNDYFDLTLPAAVELAQLAPKS